MNTNLSDNNGSHRHEGSHHDHSAGMKALFFSFLLITGFMIVETAGGILSHSLALLSDAGHMLGDSISLGLSLVALVVGAKVPANNRKTFGYRRFEILAALFNGVLLLGISIAIIIEAISRFAHPVAVASSEMMVIAVMGLVINLIAAWLLNRSHSGENLNVKSAMMHVLGDLLGSVGAIAASGLISLFGWQMADPMASVVVSLIIFRSGWSVAKESIDILMESRPGDLNISEIHDRISAVEGVKGIHDLHIWTITSGFLSLSCHLTVDDSVERDMVLKKAEQILSEYKLDHSTIQIEGCSYAYCHSDCTHQKKVLP
ncbi:cation transporter [Sporolactobacillus sp. THM7-4]|nr:cation transporter [Sporolactobacillus sp. THM7-4]